MRIWTVAIVIVLASSCADPAPPPAAVPAPDSPVELPAPADVVVAQTAEPTAVSMRDVELVMPEGLLRVRYLVGTVAGTKPGQPPAIDDPEGYSIAVESAEVAVDTRTLNRMMSADQSTSKKAPFASAEFSTEGELLVITGKQPVPFVLKGAVSVDPKGRLTVTVVELKALGIQTKGVLDALDLKLADLVDVSNQRGVVLDGNVIHVDPLVNLPEPKVIAKITGVAVEPDGLVLRLGDTGTRNPETPTEHSAKATAETAGTFVNFVAYTGGTVTQGNVTFRDTHLQLVDLDPTDPLRLAANDMGPQLGAGYMKLGEAGQMTMFLPDADEVGKPSVARSPASK